jgi:hypothetical protein
VCLYRAVIQPIVHDEALTHVKLFGVVIGERGGNEEQQAGGARRATDGPWRERLWRQKPAPLDTLVRMEMDSAS